MGEKLGGRQILFRAMQKKEDIGTFIPTLQHT